MASFRFTKLKITAGYTLLLATLLFSLMLVQREVEVLSAADNQQVLQTDSLMALLHEKDQKTLQLLWTLTNENKDLLSISEVEKIIALQDSIITQPQIRHRVVTKRDSLLTPTKKKGFFKRVAEVFAPSKHDSAILINTTLEVGVDTLLKPIIQNDSLQQKIHLATEKKRVQRTKEIRRSRTTYQRMNDHLNAQMDSIIKQYETDVVQRTHQMLELQQQVRTRSARTIGVIALGAVLLSAFFLIVILRDLSRSNRYRKELERANERAEELLAAREKLMLAITHDFKAPLSSIMGYAELLSPLTADERQRFYLDNMIGSARHLQKLVVDLLDFHRLDLNKAEVNRVTFNPSQLFDEICVSFEPLTAAKGLTFKSNVDSALNDLFICDPLRIRQITTNLLSNAVKFTQVGEVSLTVEYSPSLLTIIIADTGKGMERTDRERIFQEFTRLSGAQGEEGFGLGLSIVKKLVVLLEGTIDVWSVPAQGSRFTVTIPISPVEHSVKQETSAAETANHLLDNCVDAAPRTTVTRVLLIDDDLIQLSMTAEMLKRYAIEAVCCVQVEELLNHLRTSLFDLLLTDIQMPGVNGFELVKLLRASDIPQAKSIPIIAVTARSEMNTEAMIENGFAGCLHKPFTVNDLLNAIQVERTDNELRPSINAATSTLPNFSALTAFSDDDKEAASSIIQTFIAETCKNAQRMQQALEDKDVDGIASMAHKLLPLFMLIGASPSADLLKRLEACRGNEFSGHIEEMTYDVLTHIHQIMDEAKKYMKLSF